MFDSPQLTAAELEQVVTNIFNYNKEKNEYDRISDRKVQQLFATSYQTRYFLELIQNARDAIVEGTQGKGKVKAWLEYETLYFANNGIPFDERGVQSLCYPAVSRKESKEFIGHKGIGFNAVLEITNSPEIITQTGSFFFNVEEAAERAGWDVKDIALFRFPMFRPATIEGAFPELASDGFTTVFKFPLNDNFKSRLLEVERNSISGEDLVFLKFIKELELFGSLTTLNDNFEPLAVDHNDSLSYFKPYNFQIKFEESEINTLAEEEKTLFKDTESVEARFLLKVSEQGAFERQLNSKLHLYYAMKFTTGFPFAIHSLFSVTLERKGLHETSKLNKKLFKSIAEYYCESFLQSVKKDFPFQVLEIMAYERQANNNLDGLYNEIKSKLRGLELIYHEPSSTYCKPNEVILVTSKEYQMFRDGYLGTYKLIVEGNLRIKKWLMGECSVPELLNYHFTNAIEEKCQQYIDEPEFFQEIYQYAISKSINIQSKAVLLTQSSTCVSGNQTAVYYQVNTSLSAPKILEESVSFLHGRISISNGKDDMFKYLGLRDFSSRNLVNVALQVLEEQSSEEESSHNITIELLQFLIQFDILSDSDYVRIARAAILPVYHGKSNEKAWHSPVNSPIYFSDFSLLHEYDSDVWILDQSHYHSNEASADTWRTFFENVGVWRIPGFFILEEHTINSEGNKINVKFDRELHLPNMITPSVSRTLIENWGEYKNIILKGRLYEPIVVNEKRYSEERLRFRNSAFYRKLSSISWIYAIKEKASRTYHASEILFINQKEIGKSQNQIFQDYFPVAVMSDALNRDILNDLSLMHINYEDSANYLRILKHVASVYPEPKQDTEGIRFEKCYNRILYYLTEYFHDNKVRFNAAEFKDVLMLSKHISTSQYSWTAGSSCVHVDENILLNEIQQHNLIDKLPLQFAFTKKDKRDWGRYAKDIGKPISKLVKLSLSGEGEPKQLIGLTSHIALLTAIVEDDLVESFDDDSLLILKSIEVSVHSPLEISYTFEGDEVAAKIRQVVYSTGEEEDTEIAITKNAVNEPLQLAVALQDFFEHYTNKELKRINLLFERILRITPSKNEIERFINECNIDQARLEHISDILAQPYFIEGSEEENITIKVTPTPVVTRASITTKSTVIQETVEIIELENEGSMIDYMMSLNDYIHNDPETFEPAEPKVPSVTNEYNPSVVLIPLNYAKPQHRLADAAMKDIGMLAEYYIHQRLQRGEYKLLMELQIDAGTAASMHWYNLIKLEDETLPDQSVGKGSDFYHAESCIAIEVKGMMRTTPFITLTGPELESMRTKRTRYNLVIVKNIFDPPNITPLVINDPWGKIENGQLRFKDANLFT
jgi:predicted transcriptional regulator